MPEREDTSGRPSLLIPQITERFKDVKEKEKKKLTRILARGHQGAYQMLINLTKQVNEARETPRNAIMV